MTMSPETLFWIVSLTLTLLVEEGEGHGRLMEPPGRASMWREGFGTPADYNDNQVYCGGFYHQWHSQNGRCGVCGDPYDQPQPRQHENGGRYGTGTIVRSYGAGDVMEVHVDITAAHKGYFEFRLCPLSDLTKPATPECLDENLLHDRQGVSRFLAGNQAQVHVFHLELPPGLTCQQCVLQWKYHAGNNWGTDSEGTGIGHGPQEEFYGCADIQITPRATPGVSPGGDGGRPIESPGGGGQGVEGKEGESGGSGVGSEGGTEEGSEGGVGGGTGGGSEGGVGGGVEGGVEGGTGGDSGVALIPIAPDEAVRRTDTVCLSAKLYKGASGMDDWCTNNCFAVVSYCPPTHCECFVRVSQLNTPSNAPPNTQPNTHPNTQPRTPNAPSNTPQNTPPNSQPNTPPNTQPKTPNAPSNTQPNFPPNIPATEGLQPRTTEDLLLKKLSTLVTERRTEGVFSDSSSTAMYDDPTDVIHGKELHVSTRDPYDITDTNPTAYDSTQVRDSTSGIYNDPSFPEMYEDLVVTTEYFEGTNLNPFICVFRNNVLNSPELDQLCTNNCDWETGVCSNDLCSCSRPCARYIAVGSFSGDAHMDLFCQVTCQTGSGRSCPPSVCACADVAQRQPYCSGTGELAAIPEFGRFCEVMCTDELQELCPDYCICF